jgi:ferredoxin-type protein NapH
MKEFNSRRRLQWITGSILPIMLISGCIFPYVGYGILAMMVSFLIFSFFKGRLWCGWMCPRGAFLERYFAKLSLHSKIPPILKSIGFRAIIILLMATSFTIQFIQAQGDLSKIGGIFVRLCILTTAIAIPFAIFYKPRAWCSFCPMGTIQGWLGKTKHLIHIDKDNCKECNLCEKVCPIQTNPVHYKDKGHVESKNCIKCENCVLNCPVDSLKIKK